MTAKGRVKRAVRPLVRAVPPLRRLLDHRDRLASDILELRRTIWRFSEDQKRLLHERLDAEVEEVLREETSDSKPAETWMRHHPYARLDNPLFPTSPPPSTDDDADLVARIINAYHHSADRDHYGGEVWRDIAERHADIHDALMRRDHEAVTAMLRNPNTNYLFYGYEYFYVNGPITVPAAAQQCADRTKDALVRFAEALGLLPVENPEGSRLWGRNVRLPTGQVVDIIERHLDIEIAIRPVQAGFTGLAVGDRLLDDRMLHGAYYASRSRQLVANRAGPKVLEIGAGLGYAAYYAYQLGVRDYTIADLPLTNVAQAYFLGRMLGSDRVVLEGESSRRATDAVKIRTPTLLGEHQSFDLVLNADSITELGDKLAFEYIKRIFEMSDTMLSINHEGNEYSVAELFDGNEDVTIERFPFWLRNGYVEEIIRARRAH